MEEMSRAEFSIAYDGPALQDGTMDVRDLAPALLAVGQLFEAANKELNGNRATVKVNVVATREGSFEVIIGLSQGLISQAVDLLTSQEITAAVNLAGLVVVGSPVTACLLWLIKRAKGRNPDKIENLKDGMVRFTIDGDSFEVPLEVLRLYRNVAVRKALQKLIADPLGQEGIDQFMASHKEQTEVVDKDDAQYFRHDATDDDLLIDEAHTIAFSIVSLRFREGNRWRLNDGSNTITATIEDQGFLDRVSSNDESFSMGDVLICDVRTRQFRDGGKLKTVHTVERVVEHQEAPRTLPMKFKEPDASEAEDNDNTS